jgi:SAM-dependent methyltransferase
MTAMAATVSPQWLSLREPADAASRATDLIETLLPIMDGAKPIVVHDLGCGTGSMARWLAPRLPGPQLWVMYDQDPLLLRHAVSALPPRARDGAPIAVQARQRDVTNLENDELVGASLITASALLDVLTADELERIVDTCIRARCATLFTLSVVGRVELAPADPLDIEIGAAFNAHQCRVTPRGRLLGPVASRMAAALFEHFGADVAVRPSVWRLDSAETPLLLEWFAGWVGAACEQRPELIEAVEGYVERRMADAAAGRLSVEVRHEDVLAWPR